MNKVNGTIHPTVPPIVSKNDAFKLYHIFHTINKAYLGIERVEQPRKYIGWVMAEDLQDAWIKAQNDWNPHYREYKVRSTCIGDFIQDDEAIYMIIGNGFQKICDLEDKEHQG